MRLTACKRRSMDPDDAKRLALRALLARHTVRPVEQHELFRQGGNARVRMADDCEGSLPGDSLHLLACVDHCACERLCGNQVDMSAFFLGGQDCSRPQVIRRRLPRNDVSATMRRQGQERFRASLRCIKPDWIGRCLVPNPALVDV